jgi:hypothetical protein
MNAFAQAWQEQARVPPTDVAEMQAAMRLTSQEGIDYCDALDEVRRQYAAEQGPCEVITNYALRRGA